MCTCLKTAEKELTENAKSELLKKGKVATFDNGQFTNKGLLLNGTDNGWQFLLPFELSYWPEVKGGLAGRNKKVYKVSMTINYCPICGEKQKVHSKKEKQEEFLYSPYQKTLLEIMVKGKRLYTSDLVKLEETDRKHINQLVKWGYVSEETGCKGEESKGNIYSYYISLSQTEKVLDLLLKRWPEKKQPASLE